jgi:hypothetical protein
MTSDRGLGEKLDKAGWGLALIWIGVAILLNVGWGAGFFGLGVITLAGQLLRRFLALACDWFAVGIGVCLVLAGMGPVLGDRFGNIAVIPIVCIALGVVFLASALIRLRAA